MITFRYVLNQSQVAESDRNAVYLIYDDWDDYGFRTTFGLSCFDENGRHHFLPRINIGFVGQTTSVETRDQINGTFNNLPKGWFSLCRDVDFYKTLYSEFSNVWREEFLTALNDLVWLPELLDKVEEEKVVQFSLLRSVRKTDLKDRFASVLRGEVSLTDFEFGFELPNSDQVAGFDLQFTVKANSIPSTNMHAIIGRNGVGKTTLLKEMVRAASTDLQTKGSFYALNSFFDRLPLNPSSYFGSLVSVAFSAFDPFDGPQSEDELLHSYIGLTDHTGDHELRARKRLKSEEQLHEEFVEALYICFAEGDRRTRWEQVVETLESDKNFSDLELSKLSTLSGSSLENEALKKIRQMSSGHTIVILIVTLLVARINEKTLVLFDEPESHLQPPLLSALIRALGQLLKSRNAVAIIATHSPVVLQEIPKSCVWKVSRLKLASTKKRPDSETFGENVGTLTRDVFGLDVAKSGFHTVLADLVKQHDPKELNGYDEIVESLGGTLGYEARGILKAMILNHVENRADG